MNALSKVVTQDALEAVTTSLKDNVWAVHSRKHTNAQRLKDGAIQRKSVGPDRYNLHVSMNPEMVGFYKRE